MMTKIENLSCCCNKRDSIHEIDKIEVIITKKNLTKTNNRSLFRNSFIR